MENPYCSCRLLNTCSGADPECEGSGTLLTLRATYRETGEAVSSVCTEWVEPTKAQVRDPHIGPQHGL